MKVQFGYKPETYETSGCELRIHWDIIENNEQWESYEAVCDVGDTRNVLIEKIIGSSYTTSQEFATINNKDTKPDEYAAYQSFRVVAKQLADGWVNR